MAEKKLCFLTPHPPNPMNFHHIPSRDQKGALLYRRNLFLRTSTLVLQRHMKLDMSAEQSLDSDHHPTPPLQPGLVMSPVSGLVHELQKEKKKTGGIQCVDVLLLFSLCGRWGWTYQGGRDGRGGTLVTESVLGWMGVLYNVELVNCVQWCRHDDIELLFLFYELTVSVI